MGHGPHHLQQRRGQDDGGAARPHLRRLLLPHRSAERERAAEDARGARQREQAAPGRQEGQVRLRRRHGHEPHVVLVVLDDVDQRVRRAAARLQPRQRHPGEARLEVGDDRAVHARDRRVLVGRDQHAQDQPQGHARLRPQRGQRRLHGRRRRVHRGRLGLLGDLQRSGEVEDRRQGRDHVLPARPSPQGPLRVERHLGLGGTEIHLGRAQEAGETDAVGHDDGRGGPDGAVEAHGGAAAERALLGQDRQGRPVHGPAQEGRARREAQGALGLLLREMAGRAQGVQRRRHQGRDRRPQGHSQGARGGRRRRPQRGEVAGAGARPVRGPTLAHGSPRAGQTVDQATPPVSPPTTPSNVFSRFTTRPTTSPTVLNSAQIWPMRLPSGPVPPTRSSVTALSVTLSPSRSSVRPANERWSTSQVAAWATAALRVASDELVVAVTGSARGPLIPLRASAPLATPEIIPTAWIVPLRFSNLTMLKEPVNVPPPVTVPVNGTTSFADDDFEPPPSFDFESSAPATDTGPIAVTSIRTLSRVDRALMLHPPGERSWALKGSSRIATWELGVQTRCPRVRLVLRVSWSLVTDPHGLARGLTNYGDADFSLYLRRSFATSMGYSREMLARPVVGIAQSASGFNNCHRHFPELIDAVKRGVVAAGGLPLDFPTISLGEVFLSPTSMMFRNLMSIDVEEMIRAQLMGAASADVPAVQLLAGPMMPMAYHGERLGACTDCRRFWAKYRAGGLSATEIQEIEGNLAATAGTCAVMGTASTMAALAETLGMALPGTAAIPAVHADRLRAAEASGRQAVALATAGLRPSRIMTAKAIENALRVLLAIGGSTNAIIHLTAIAGRVGVPISLTRLNELSDSTPVLVDLKPTGQHYMSDLHAAGGVGAVLRELKPLLHLDCLTVSGETLGARLAAEPGWVDRAVVRPLDDPYQKQGGLVALFGSLAPGGAILKRSAADSALFEREGRAVVFSSMDDLAARIDAADLDVTPDDFLVMQNAGPKSGYAMPEAGYLPIPARLAKAGVKDMVRISDARMSGTAYGTIVLHVSPEAAVGGPLALVKSGDRIRLSVARRVLDLRVP